MATKKRASRAKKSSKTKGRSRVTPLPEYDNAYDDVYDAKYDAPLEFEATDVSPWNCESSCDDFARDDRKRQSLFSRAAAKVRDLELREAARAAWWHATRPNSIVCTAVVGAVSAGGALLHVYEAQFAVLVSLASVFSYVMGNAQGRTDGRW